MRFFKTFRRLIVQENLGEQEVETIRNIKKGRK